MYDQLVTIIILNGGNTENIFFKIWRKTSMPSLTGFIQFIIWGLSAVRQLEDIKRRLRRGKKEVKDFLFASNIVKRL